MIVVSAESVLVVSFGSRFSFNCTFQRERIRIIIFNPHTAEIVELPAIRLSFGAESDPPDLGTHPQKDFRTERTNAPLFPTLAHARNEIGTCVSIQNGAFLSIKSVQVCMSLTAHVLESLIVCGTIWLIALRPPMERLGTHTSPLLYRCGA